MYQIISSRDFNSFMELLEKSSDSTLCAAFKESITLKDQTNSTCTILRQYEKDYKKFYNITGNTIDEVIKLINIELSKRFCKILDKLQKLWYPIYRNAPLSFYIESSDQFNDLSFYLVKK